MEGNALKLATGPQIRRAILQVVRELGEVREDVITEYVARALAARGLRLPITDDEYLQSL